MLERQAEIQNKLGLHARAASVFVQKAQGLSSHITVHNSNTSADGKSIMNMIAILALIDDKFGEGE